MDKIQPTRGQVERDLSQRIQVLYRENWGKQPSKVTCQIFSDKLMIVAEDSVTPTEQLLWENGREKLAEEVRSGLNKATIPLLKELIEEALSVTVTDILNDATLETGRTGIIAILNESPYFRRTKRKS